MINDKDKIVGIYKIENKYNHKIYIGQSKDIVSRCKNHINTLKNEIHRNKELQNDFSKYGLEGFTFKIIESCKLSDLKEIFGDVKYHWDIVLLCREYYYMKYYSQNHELYNIQDTLKEELLAQRYIPRKFNNVQKSRNKQSQTFINFIKTYPVVIQNNGLSLLELFSKVFSNEDSDNYIDYGKTYSFSNFYKQAKNKNIITNNKTKNDIKNIFVKLNILYYKNGALLPHNKYVKDGYFALDRPKYRDDKISHYRISITKSGIKFLNNLLKDNI